MDRVFFVQADFYDQLMFKAVYDMAEKKYKADVRLPPGQHGICFIEVLIDFDSNGQLGLKFRRIEWKNETIYPCTDDFSHEARIKEELASKSVGALFTSSLL